MNETPAPAPTLPRNAAGWLALFGPGAIVASLTIGSGELVFSSRGGALFGYRLLGLFLIICLLKWALVLATARHLVLTGAHPLQRWIHLPGPAGWLPWVFLLLAVVSFPVWVGFHAGTVGTLLASLAGTTLAWRGASHFVWGLGVLAGMMVLVWSGSYQRLERVQLIVVLLMLACVSVSLVLLRPDAGELLRGLVGLGGIRYPEWIDQYPELRQRALWVELVTYVGVIGGSGYDYLAYVSFLREKRWGQAAGPIVDSRHLATVAADPRHVDRRWIVAPLVDATLSFAIVLLFSAIFLACGAEVLRPQQKYPGGSDLLTLQSEFVASGLPGLQPLYYAGALLAMLGTLYGTIEVAPAIVQELLTALGHPPTDARRWHRGVTGYVSFGGALVLLVSLLVFLRSGTPEPPSLIAMLTPANLFTGVLACGIIALSSLWMDRRWLPPQLRSPRPLRAINLVGGCLLVALGIKAYWDHGGLAALGMLLLTLLVGGLLAAAHNRLWD
jgi:hypothetical protein